MSKRLLLVAYPLLPVSESSAGGAEQILWTLERELSARGWETEVAACAGSQVSGELLATDVAESNSEQEQSQLQEQGQLLHPSKRSLDGAPAQEQGQLPHVSQQKANVGHPVVYGHKSADGHPEDRFAERAREHADRVVVACASGDFAMVLDHSGHFFRHAARVDSYVLATLHLPRQLYAAGAFEGLAKNVYFNCVSDSQRREFMDLPRMLGVVRNGIAVERFATVGRRSGYLLWMGRVCPEKAPHLAIAAARRAALPIVLAGQVYPFRWHENYWEREVKPLIDGDRVRWVPLPSFAEKAKLLREARALLVSSRIAETTSLVALEAMASGTPVIAFAAGALTEVVTKETGFLVRNVEGMAEACGEVNRIRAQDCRAWVKREYSAKAMVDGYEALIRGLAEQTRWEQGG